MIVLFCHLQFDEIFHPYIQYCMEEARCLAYLKEKRKEDDKFREYLTVRTSIREILFEKIRLIGNFGFSACVP